MIYKSKPGEQLHIYSMGKRLRVIAIANDTDEANRFMAEHDEAAVIACLGPFILLANKYDQGERA